MWLRDGAYRHLPEIDGELPFDFSVGVVALRAGATVLPAVQLVGEIRVGKKQLKLLKWSLHRRPPTEVGG